MFTDQYTCQFCKLLIPSGLDGGWLPGKGVFGGRGGGSAGGQGVRSGSGLMSMIPLCAFQGNKLQCVTKEKGLCSRETNADHSLAPGEVEALSLILCRWGVNLPFLGATADPSTAVGMTGALWVDWPGATACRGRWTRTRGGRWRRGSGLGFCRAWSAGRRRSPLWRRWNTRCRADPRSNCAGWCGRGRGHSVRCREAGRRRSTPWRPADRRGPARGCGSSLR